MMVLILILVLTWNVPSRVLAAERMASACVCSVDSASHPPVIRVDAGSAAGLAVRDEVTVLRPEEPIVHPVTGEVLGVPEEPVGVGRVTAVSADSATVQLIRVYSAPQPGDSVEYARAGSSGGGAPAASDTADLNQVRAQLRSLAQEIAREKQHGEKHRTIVYPVSAREVWNDLNSMRSYLISLDERLLALETQQQEELKLLGELMRGERPAQDTRQFSLRYDADTQVRVRIAGKTLIVHVEPDSLRLVAEEAEPSGQMSPPVPGPEIPVISVSDTTSGWQRFLDRVQLTSPVIQAVSLGVIALLAGVLYVLMRRRERDALAELEDLDMDYLEEDEE